MIENMHKEIETLLNPSWYKKAPIFLPMNNKDSEIENENGRDVTPSTKTLRAYG